MNYSSGSRIHLSSLSFQRDIFVCLFGDLFPTESEDARFGGFDDGGGGSSRDADDLNYPSSEPSQSRQDNYPPAENGTECGNINEPDVMNHPGQSACRDLESTYETASLESSPSRPMSNFQDYIQLMPASMWPDAQSESDSADQEGQTSNHNLPGLAHGFEKQQVK